MKMSWIECREPGCSAPAEPDGRVFGIRGVGTRGQDIVVWYERRLCAAGHRYQVELYEEDAEDVDGA
jgi:hypothetical protein